RRRKCPEYARLGRVAARRNQRERGVLHRVVRNVQASFVNPVNAAGVRLEYRFVMSGRNESPALVGPAGVSSRQFKDRPVAAPDQPFGSESVPQMIEDRGKGLRGSSGRELGQEARKLA